MRLFRVGTLFWYVNHVAPSVLAIERTVQREQHRVPPSPLHQRLIHRDARKPGEESGPPLEGVDPREDPAKDHLSNVFSVLLIERDPVGDATDALLIFRDKDGKSFL